MRNKDVVKSFYEGESGSSVSLKSSHGRLYSYFTCIAEKLSNGKIIKNVTKYSNTTSKHQYLVDKYDYIVDNVPIEAASLRKYLTSTSSTGGE